MDLGLTGRVVLITGGSVGLGLGAARVLTGEGARVVLVARGADRLAAATAELTSRHGDDAAIAIAADVCDAADLERVVSSTIEHHGRVDALVNNAGVSRGLPFLEADDAQWAEDIDLKVMAAVRLSRLVLPHMRRQGGGRIVNVLNTAAKAPAAASAPTSVTRAAGLALTKVLSKEFAADAVLVNAILIGLVRSDQWQRRWEREGSKGTIEDLYAQMARSVPLGRVGTEQEFGDLVAFLLSDRAGFITGCGINLDGGMSAVV